MGIGSLPRVIGPPQAGLPPPQALSASAAHRVSRVPGSADIIGAAGVVRPESAGRWR